MKAMVLQDPGPVEDAPLDMRDVDDPEPGPGQVRLKVSICGACHTDLHTVEGEIDLPLLPLIPGHQIVGTVDKMGEGVSQRRLGDRLGVAWVNGSCGKCELCTKGLDNLCDQARFTGLHTNGGYAQHVVVDQLYAFPIPDKFTDAEASPLLCAGIIGYRSLKLSEIEPGQRLGLYGFGASAHIAIQVARHWGCMVYVFTRSQDHRDHAMALGAEWAGDARDESPEKLDSAITFAPAGWIVPLALGRLVQGGTLAINAIHMSPIPEMAYSTIYQERTVRSVTNFTRQDAVEFLKLAGELPVRTDVETHPLEEANQVLQKLKRSEIRGAAVLEIPQ